MRALRSVPVLLDIARDVEAVAPDAWLVNVTNPLTALCRSVTRETGVKTVGLCNEWVGCYVDPEPAARLRHGTTSTRCSAASTTSRSPRRAARRRRRRRLRRACARCWTIPSAPRPSRSGWIRPSDAGWTKVSPAEHWTKLDVIENNRVRFELFRRFGVLAGFGRPPLGRVHAGLRAPRQRLRRATGACTTTAWRATGADADDDVEYYEEMRDAPDVTRMPSGELVAPLLDGMVTGKPRTSRSTCRTRATSRTSPDGAVVEIMGVADGAGVRGRDKTTVPGIMGEFLRRINVVQEWTVEAARHRRPRRSCSKRCSPTRWRRSFAYDEIVDDDRRDARGDRPLAPDSTVVDA